MLAALLTGKLDRELHRSPTEIEDLLRGRWQLFRARMDVWPDPPAFLSEDPAFDRSTPLWMFSHPWPVVSFERTEWFFLRNRSTHGQS